MKPELLVCVDWSKEAKGRVAYVADVKRRVVQHLAFEPRTLQGVMTAARAYRSALPTVIGIDAPLGVPDAYARALGVQTFRGFLQRFQEAGFNKAPVKEAIAWSPSRPFIDVPKGAGSLRAFHTAAGKQGASLMRDFDRATGAKSPFIVSGIPGTAGSGARALWAELADVAGAVSLWGSDPGDLTMLMRAGPPVLAEIYPGLLYAAALANEPRAQRARLRLAKTKPLVRSKALDELLAARWIAQHAVTLQDVDRAHASEDAFDALLSAAALLRTVLDDEPLDGSLGLPGPEGAMLGASTVNVAIPAVTFRTQAL